MRKRLMRRNDLQGVTFFGRVTEEKKLELMRRAHVLLVPGVREGWGRVVTEANAMGTPAVGYNIPGLRDSIRDGETGVLCTDQPEEMAKATTQLLTQDEEREKLSRNALKWAKEFGWDRSVTIFIERISWLTERSRKYEGAVC